MLYYTTDEGKEGRDAFNEKRKPDFQQFLSSLNGKLVKETSSTFSK